MSNFFKRLFGGKETEKSLNKVTETKKTDKIESNSQKPASTDVKENEKVLEYDAQWNAFFKLAPLHNSVHKIIVSFVGSWPNGINPNQFSPSAVWQSIVDRVRNHLAMPYPLSDFGTGSNAPRPQYRMVDGRIARESNPMIDMILCTVLPQGASVNADAHILVWRLIERYSAFPLSKLIFLLPRLQDASREAASGKAAVLVIEDMLIQVYKGVENILFGIYDDLPEGGRLSDELVEHKLRSLLQK